MAESVFNRSYRLYIQVAADVLKKNDITKDFLEQYDVSVMDVILHSLTGENKNLTNVNIGDLYVDITELCANKFTLDLEDAFDILDNIGEKAFVDKILSEGDLSQKELDTYFDARLEDDRGYSPIWLYMEKLSDLIIYVANDILWNDDISLDWQLDDDIGDKIYKLLK